MAGPGGGYSLCSSRCATAADLDRLRLWGGSGSGWSKDYAFFFETVGYPNLADDRLGLEKQEACSRAGYLEGHRSALLNTRADAWGTLEL